MGKAIVLFLFIIGFFLMIAQLIVGNTKKESTKTNKSNKSKEEEQEIFVEAGLKLMAKVMAADRANMVCELDIIKQFIKKYDNDNFKKHVEFVKDIAFKTKNAANKNLSECDNLIEQINEVSNFTRKKWFLEYLFEISFADGSCGAEERMFLKRIADKLEGLDMSTYNFMVKKYEKQAKGFTGTRKTEEFSQYEASNDDSTENKYNSYSSHGYTYSGKYSYQSSSNTSDNKESNNSHEQQRRPLTELEKAYAALDLTEAATDKEIKARRRNLMRLNHPDLVMQKGDAAIRSANLRCQEINKAFEVIKASRGMK